MGNLLWALELLQQCENYFGILVLQFVDCLLGGCIVGLRWRVALWWGINKTLCIPGPRKKEQTVPDLPVSAQQSPAEAQADSGLLLN